MKTKNTICTSHGEIHFPAFFPVTTYGDKYPLDKLVQPYLRRTSPCIMVSHYYAKQMTKRPNMPVFIDSGGFAGLFEGAEFIDHGEYASIKTKEGEEISPLDVLHFQIKNADIGATLDFIIPPGLEQEECKRRQELTIKNALYAQKHNIVGNLILYASLQCWDEASARENARIYSNAGFTGIAIGGMVPRAKDLEYMATIIRAVREEAPHCAIHVFGIGNTSTIPVLIKAGADSFDSSSYVRNAVETRKENGCAGIHANLYAAINRLYEINSIIYGTSTPIEQVIPNTKLCLV